MESATQATPPVNVYESAGQLSVATPIPGSHAEHVAVVVTPDRLELEAECKYAQDEQHYLRRDWQVGSWKLQLELPRRVAPERARAVLRHGVLVVMAPLSEHGAGQSQPVVE
ncbi:MAG: Hsp20/alpha crystallin family protein [Candidatus Dormiibacterota bacterium]